MDDIDVWADETLRHQGFPAAGRPGLAAALVHRGNQAQLLGQSEIMGAHLERGIVRAQHRHAERDQRVAVAQRALQQALDLPARMRDFREMRLARFGVGLGRAVEEGGADAALFQARNAGIGVLRRRIVVAPIHQGCDTVVDLVERARQRGDMDVFGCEHGGEARMHVAKIFQQGPVGRDRAQRRLPGVHMGVDQAGQHEMPRAVDRLRLGLDRRRDGGDAVVLDQHVAGRQHADLRILRDDDAGFQQQRHG